MSFLSHLECSRCHQTHDADRLQNLCTCGGPLLVRYDLKAVARAVRPANLAGRVSSLWRYRELLPLRDDKNLITLGEGMTPLFPLPRLGASVGLPDLWLKDEGLNPTASFKARGAATGVSRAKELGVTALAMPTNGNAGGAWASYGARAGISVTLVMPTDAPAMSVLEATAVGAHAYMVRGQITDAGAIVGRSAKAHGWFEAATLKEPYRIEGKKTMGYEIAEQLGWSLPDVILYPTGGGVGIIGIYKALLEMRELGWLPDSVRFPKLVAVQAEGCQPIVKAFREGKDVSEKWENASTVAQGIRVPKALGDFLVLQAVRETGGTCVAVSDADTLWGLEQISRQEGAFICPEGAALVGAARQLLREGWLDAGQRVLLLNTGAGIKYPDVMSPKLPILELNATL
ncbi:Threonine synthase [Cystobacter fuscus DSM 2262]|uniref:Threonine synthase n=1 Tax=Cystobacter fuscus (strain ATCC 25194 / DSM 2262 / NBRC 100088 / M29) TaxID=1242864 RepID=S9PCZ2_CYSF2|nr:threonine synthase [Cystobacter fuscus]EPX60961.1 Threonine synthase [Cystobacter fuscus DSM 2262]